MAMSLCIKCNYAECKILIVMMNDIRINDIMLSVVASHMITTLGGFQRRRLISQVLML
jgi:hypothetical protein